MKIAIVGTGYVGLVTGAGLADFGWNVTCIDKEKGKIERLKNGEPYFYEQGLEALIKKNMEEGRLSFTNDAVEAIKNSDVVFIAVGTPSNEDGSTDLSQVYEAAKTIAKSLKGYKLIVLKSTVPIGTTKNLLEFIKASTDNNFDIAFNPEFLREGSAVYDFFHPDRVIIGAETPKAIEILKSIYRPLYLIQTPFLITDIETAELIKYAANSFLAMKITFINEIANLCEKVGADVNGVAKALGLDGRIGPKFLHPGPGYGGSCFPKDTKSIAFSARKYGSPLTLVEATIQANERQRDIMVAKIEKMLGGSLKDKIVGVLGLSFKPETDDIREAPSLKIIENLLKKRALVKAFDPKAMNNTRKMLGDKIEYCNNEYEVATNANILVIVTEWNQFRTLDLDKLRVVMKEPKIADFRNLLDPKLVKEKGFVYEGVGRK
jgi:UDPglucose 6-dehydrogenase